MMTGNLVIENCVAGEEPSYKATVIVGAKSEEDARKQFGKLEDVFGLDLSDTAFRFDDKDDSTNVSVVNVGGGRGGVHISGNITGGVVMGGGRVVINGVDMSEIARQGEVVTGAGIKKKEVVLRIPAYKESSFDFTSQTGNIDIGKVSGKGRLRTTSANIRAQELNGNFSVSSRSGDLNVAKVDGKLDFKAQSGDVSIKKIEGHCNVNTQSGDVTIKDITLAKDASINTMSGDVDINISNRNAGVRIRTTSGDISLPDEDFSIDNDTRQRNQGNNRGGSYINVSGGGSVVIVGNVGGESGGYVEGHFGEGSNAPQLDVETMSGDIDIDSTGKQTEPKTVEKDEVKCPFCGTVNPPRDEHNNCGACGGTFG